jgi:hypothetical protein
MRAEPISFRSDYWPTSLAPEHTTINPVRKSLISTRWNGDLPYTSLKTQR